MIYIQHIEDNYIYSTWRSSCMSPMVRAPFFVSFREEIYIIIITYPIDRKNYWWYLREYLQKQTISQCALYSMVYDPERKMTHEIRIIV